MKDRKQVDSVKTVSSPPNMKEDIQWQAKAYACQNRSEEIRMQSSSGGIFTLLAEKVIEQSGSVYGAAFSEDDSVHHIRIDKREEIGLLRGSKYMQSDIEDSFRLVRRDLKRQTVLFSGTPCQVAGLKAYLGKEYDNLICVDIICHGVPSAKVWKKYLESLEKRTGEKKKQNEKPLFRDKKTGWLSYSVRIPFTNGTEFCERYFENAYMKAFLQNIDLRPSCYSCQFKNSGRADITLGDFWGIQDIIPELFDNKGTSLIRIHSSKGQKLFWEVSEKMDYRETAYEKAVRYNPSAIQSPPVPLARSRFFRKIDTCNMECQMEKMTRNRLPGRIARKILSRAKTIRRRKGRKHC